MKQLILGKIILLVSIFTFYLHANPTSSVDKTKFYLGDTVTLSIKASGEDVQFPNINKIGDYPVSSSGSSQKISIVKGKTSKTKIMQFTFQPKSSMTIPSFDIKISGTVTKTPTIDIQMIEPTASSKNDPINLIIETNKKSYYIGEPIISTITFKYQANIEILDAKLDPLEIKDFWRKEMQSPAPRQINDYITYQVNNLLFAKKSGKITIPNQIINVAKRSQIGFAKWEKVFSNKLELDIKPLPNGVNTVGDFTLTATVDKKETNPNEPINLTIHIKGNGNFDDIRQFNLNMPKQVLYNSTPEVQTSVVKDKLTGTFTQKVSIISDESYTIPEIAFPYFDLSTQTVKIAKTKPISIDIINNTKKETPKIETLQSNIEPQVVTKIEYVETDSYVKYIFGLIGLLLGSLITFFITKKKQSQKDYSDKPLVKQIKNAKTEKELYNVLLPYIKDEYIHNYIKLLEGSIYSNKEQKLQKVELLEYVKEKIEI